MPVDPLHLDPDREAVEPLPPPPEPKPASAADEMRAVEHRLAIARNRMLRRLIEVSHRVDHARAKMDVGRIIGDHPIPAVGVAAAAGALLALPGKRGSGKRSVPARMGGLVGALAFALVKDGLSMWLKRSIANARERASVPSTSPIDSPSAFATAETSSSTSGVTTLPELPPVAR